MIQALLLGSESSFCHFFLLLFNTLATPPANRHCSQKSVSEPVLAMSLAHQQASARRSIIEKETIGRVPCHQLAFMSGTLMFLYLEPWFPFCRRLKNIFQQSWVCTASVSWDLGLGKCHTFWCISTLLLLIPYQIKAVGVQHACWPLTFAVKNNI